MEEGPARKKCMERSILHGPGRVDILCKGLGWGVSNANLFVLSSLNIFVTELPTRNEKEDHDFQITRTNQGWDEGRAEKNRK